MFWKRKPEDKPQDKQFKELDDRIRGLNRAVLAQRADFERLRNVVCPHETLHLRFPEGNEVMALWPDRQAHLEEIGDFYCTRCGKLMLAEPVGRAELLKRVRSKTGDTHAA